MYPVILLVVLTFPFIDFEVMRLFGKSIVLPYFAAALLSIPAAARPSSVARLLSDPGFPFLLIWVLIAGVAAGLAGFRYQDSGFLRYVWDQFVLHNATQVLSVLIMVIQYALFVCALSSLRVREIERVIGLFILIGTIGALYSLYQVGSVFFGWPYEDVLRTSNLYLKAATLDLGGFGGWISFPRAYGTAPEPSLWGIYLVVVAGFLLGRLSAEASLKNVVGAVLVTAGILITFSRGAWFAFAAVVLMWLVGGRWPRRLNVAAPVFVLIVLAATFWPMLVSGEFRPSPLADLSAQDRIFAHLTGLSILWDNPLFGVGFGSVPFLIDRYLVAQPSYHVVRFQGVFSFFLLVFIATGIIGATAFLVYLANLLDRLCKAFAIPLHANGPRGVRLGTMLACMGILASWVNTPAYNISYIWFCLALASVLPTVLGAAERPKIPL